MATKVQADTDLGNGWSAADLLDALAVHGLEYTLTEFDVEHLDELPKLQQALGSAKSAVIHLRSVLHNLGFDDLETEDF